MKKEKLFEAIGDLNENYISEAHQTTKRRSHHVWLRWGTIAACFALILGLGIGAFNLHRRDNGGMPGEGIENPAHQDTGKPNPSTVPVIDMPIIWGNTDSVEYEGYTEWSGKRITLSLYDALSDEKNKDSLIAISARFQIDTNFVYNGKSLAEYDLELDNEQLLYQKLGQLLKLGDWLKYGDALYKTGTPTCEKWPKELYDKTIETIGKDLIAKYIVDGELLKEKLNSDIAELSEHKPCRVAYEEACNAFYQAVVDGSIKQLEKQNINYEKRDKTTLVFFATADEFSPLSLDNVLYFKCASKDPIDRLESSANDY